MFEYYRQLLADETRTNAFREAIRRVVKEGDVVVEIGAGPGLLSFFACEAGAKHVYAIDQHPIIDTVYLLAKKFGFDDRVTVIRARSTNVEFKVKANVLITETLGSAGFDEGFLSTVSDARKRLLTPDARIIPSHVDLWIAPIEWADLYERYVEWWSSPRYGFDVSPIRMFAANTVFSALVPQSALLAEPEVAIKVDSATIDRSTASGSAMLRTNRAGTAHAFIVGFNTIVADGVTLSNAWRGADSWHHGILPLEQPMQVDRDTPIRIELSTDDGRQWNWTGEIAGTPFAQTNVLTQLSSLPLRQ